MYLHDIQDSNKISDFLFCFMGKWLLSLAMTKATVMFLKLIIISAVLLLFALAGLGIGILLKPKGRFPEIHVGRNREMCKRGLGCARQTDVGCNPVGSKDGLKSGSFCQP
jgi:hypothetical protein